MPDGSVTAGFAGLMVQLAGAWSVRLDEVRIRVYARALHDVTLDELRRVCGQAIRECRYFPSVAELRAFVVPSGEDAGLLAWTALGRAAAEAGAYACVIFEDGAIAEALETVFGSWGGFCAQEEGPALGARRQEFLAAYRVARHRQRGERRLTGVLPPPPPDAATHTWVARVALGGAVTIERDRPQLTSGATHAALPEARTETGGEGA